MVYYNLIQHIFLNIIFLDIFIKLFIIFRIIYKKLFNKSKDIFQYKINNLFQTQFFVLIYILIFIVFFDLLKILNIGKGLNLIDLKTNIFIFFNFFIKINFLLTSIIIILILILLILFILLLKFITQELFKLHIYYNQPIYALRMFVTKEEVKIPLWKKIYIKILRNLVEINDLDLISFILWELFRKFIFRFLGPLDEMEKHFFYSFYSFFWRIFVGSYKKYYNLFIKLSPLIFILYDCIFNNFIVIHVYYYLLIYTPLMLLLKITKFLMYYSKYIGQTLWLIYYDRSNPIYAISKKYLVLLEVYVKYNLSIKHFIKNVSDVFTESDNALFLLHVIQFELYNQETNTYRNCLGDYIQITVEGKAFQELEDPNKIEDYIYLGEEWIILTDNRNIK